MRLYEERVAGWDVDEGFRQQWSAWCQRLLAHGGELVVPPGVPEPDLDLLVADGTLLALPINVADLGGDCHANVAKLWIDGEIAAVGTGYALSGGLWRQHSWGVTADGGIVETKTGCELYCGVTLPPGERTVQFALNGFDGDVKARLREGGGRTGEIISVLRASRQRRSAVGPR
ncbi:hypothetical protein Val02_49270 [Virgisporangium aliadipatigenens]|uniref:Uncharacterized protein n=2 Tax=Virgisporangium aliadipatigenens TaxID=741659 RepID=A0A8J4DSC7_9ACTN|nr:hypothetical protein Val02_49270 [Virgisporangium aliadipatigenens]